MSSICTSRMAESNGVWGIRAAGPEDLAFVSSSWLESFATSAWAKRVNNSDQMAVYARAVDERPGARTTPYHVMHKVLIRRLMSASEVRIAHFEEDPSVIFGFSVVQGDCLHYVLVKHDFRGQGIAKSLVPETVTWCSHASREVSPIRLQRSRQIRCPDPYRTCGSLFLDPMMGGGSYSPSSKAPPASPESSR